MKRSLLVLWASILIGMSCWSPLAFGDEKKPLRYPIILHHGFLGFNTIGPFGYFFRVKKMLKKNGYQVYTSNIDPMNSIEIRGGELDEFVGKVIQKTGAEKVHIIAHSMGGLDARFMISSLNGDEKVASLSMIGTPNRGTPIADIILKELQSLEFKIVPIFRRLVGLKKSVFMKRIFAVAGDLSVKRMTESFNPSMIDSSKVFYQSWAGLSSPGAIDTEDWMIPILHVPALIVRASEGENDGLVSVSSQMWGQYNGTIAADHLDEVGHPFGGTSYSFKHLKFYRRVAKTLETLESETLSSSD